MNPRAQDDVSHFDEALPDDLFHAPLIVLGSHVGSNVAGQTADSAAAGVVNKLPVNKFNFPCPTARLSVTPPAELIFYSIVTSGYGFGPI